MITVPQTALANHILSFSPTFFHPNGNIYWTSIEKMANGAAQDIAVYRSTNFAFTEVYRKKGGIDSLSQFALGGAGIHPNGALVVGVSTTPLQPPRTNGTGFTGVYDIVPNIDAPWSGLGVSNFQYMAAELPNNGTPYTSDAQINSAPGFYVRFNKLMALVKRIADHI